MGVCESVSLLSHVLFSVLVCGRGEHRAESRLACHSLVSFARSWAVLFLIPLCWDTLRIEILRVARSLMSVADEWANADRPLYIVLPSR